MCNWRSASPSGFAPHTPPPPPHPSHRTLQPHPSPPSPLSTPCCCCWGGLCFCCHQAAGLSAVLFPPFFPPAALLGVTRLLKQCWHLYQSDLILCPFPPSLHLLSSSHTPGSITLRPELLTTTHKKLNGENYSSNYNNNKYRKKNTTVFPLQQAAHEINSYCLQHLTVN